MALNGDHPTLADAQTLLPDAVFLAIETGTKKPVRPKWQKISFAETQKPGYQRFLANAETIGVLLGQASNWLSDLDCDTDPYLDFMLLNNEWLRCTLRTRGVRAGGIWFRNRNHAFDGIYTLHVDAKSSLAAGGKIDEKTGLVKIGELRCGHGQSIICGLHPDDVYYQWPEKCSPTELDPLELIWPEEILPQLPWNKKQQKSRARSRQQHPDKHQETGNH